MPDSRSLLKFQIGPVQDFIAQARKTQDLWAGSWLLSFLLSRGAVEAQRFGAEIISPKLDCLALTGWHSTGSTPVQAEELLEANVPNQFAALVPVERGAEIAGKVEAAVRGLWLEIAGDVHGFIARHLEKSAIPLADWNTGWEEQVRRFPHFDWVVVPPGAGAAAPLPRGVPGVRADSTVPHCRQVAQAEWLFAAAKNSRSFARWSGRPAHKDHLDGFREVMGGGKPNEFWEALRALPAFQHCLKGHQLYGAVSLVKRLFPEAYLVGKLKWEARKPSPASVHAIARGLDQDDGEEVQPGDPTYYAILVMDGDNMGEWAGGARECSGNLDSSTDEFPQALSGVLSAFAGEDVPPLIQEHHGKLIYAGGDDVMAMLPANEALACAGALSDAFRRRLPGASASAGIAIGHVRSPLQDTIQAARDAESVAKGLPGKDAFCLRVLKRSGEAVELAAKWNTGVQEVMAAMRAHEPPLPGRFAHNLATRLKRLLADAPQDSDHGWQEHWDNQVRQAAILELTHSLSRLPGLSRQTAEATARAWQEKLGRLTSPRYYLHFWSVWAFLRRLEEEERSSASDSAEASPAAV